MWTFALTGLGDYVRVDAVSACRHAPLKRQAGAWRSRGLAAALLQRVEAQRRIEGRGLTAGQIDELRRVDPGRDCAGTIRLDDGRGHGGRERRGVRGKRCMRGRGHSLPLVSS